MKVHLEIFDGPLDLLLYLIKKDHLNIHDIPMVMVVDQYLQFLDLMKILDVNVASEYMAVAATLISIKSKMLLPRDPGPQEPEEDPREELVKRLLEYEKFKEAAEFLKTKERERVKYAARSTDSADKKEFFLEASIFDLINAFKTALKEVPKDIFLQVIQDEFTVEAKIHDLLHLLLIKERMSLDDLFRDARSKIEIVVTFLAILELIKMREIVAFQEELFGRIMVSRRDNVVTAP